MEDFKSKSYENTIEIGTRFGCSLSGGEVVILSGKLGSGKTAFTKGVALGLGIEEVVTSPSFTIMNEYEGKLCLCHFDFYRIDEKTEMVGLLEDYIYKKNKVVVIEWGEKLLDVLETIILVKIRIYETHRMISLERRGV